MPCIASRSATPNASAMSCSPSEARGSATREATLRCGEPVQLQLWVRIFCLQSRRRARCRAGPWAFCKLCDDAIVPLICPTCQNVFAGFAQSIHVADHHATLHGVVFDILVGSESRAGHAAVFPVDDRSMACQALARADSPPRPLGLGAA
jgi:hypothetical protein